MEERLLNGETITLENDKEDIVLLWHNSITGAYCIELNGKVVNAKKTFAPIKKTLDSYGSFTELE